MSQINTPSSSANQKLSELSAGVNTLQMAESLWNRHLSEPDRERLASETKFSEIRKVEQCVSVGELHGGAVGMWMKLRGVSKLRAILDVARRTDLLTEGDYQWLLREFGETSNDPNTLMQQAIKRGDLVLRQDPRSVFWKKKKVNFDWAKSKSAWDYFWELCRSSKSGGSLHADRLGEDLQLNNLIKKKSKLTTDENFPVDLSDLILNVAERNQRLEFPPERIHIFEAIDKSTLRVWTP